MRETKFMFWNPDMGEMSEPYTLEDLAYQGFPHMFVNEHGDFERSCIKRQYTGLKDKNGKEIYEGDLCKHKGRERVYKVEFDYNGARPFHPDIYSSAPNDSTGTFYPITIASSNEDRVSCCQEWEIIGNIYENSELLEGIKT